MKTFKILTLVIIAAVLFSAVGFAQELSKDQWQSEMNTQTAKRNELKAKLDKLVADINNLKNQSTKLDADVAACEDELYKMLGMTRDQVDAFDRELSGYERRADELMRMADADLLKNKDEVNTMSKRVDEMTNSKVGSLSRFRDRLASLRTKIDGLLATLSKMATNVYTVGTWKRDRDCLWNIAKKPNTYNNAWLWPKIWQGNKDKIRDPDVIKPGWKLTIPAGKELNKAEKAAANSYYRKKAKG